MRTNRPGTRILLLSLLLAASPVFGDGKDGDEKKEDGLPLKAARSFELTVDEATRMSLDVAPDGEAIVFELLGDLYTLPIAGGEATRLTEGFAFDSQPAFSPDGKRIAFLSDRDGAENLWILPVGGGEPKKLSQDTKATMTSPAWTPDGNYVVVSRSPNGDAPDDLWMYHVQGGSGIQVTKSKEPGAPPYAPRFRFLGAAPSPDGRYLYFTRRRGNFTYNANFPIWQVVRRDLVDGAEDVLTSAPGSAIRPVLSPDGRRMVYGTRHDAKTGLRVRDLETGEDRWLTYPVSRDDQEGWASRDLLPGYDFLPSGDAIVASIDGKLYRVAIADGARTEIPFTAEVKLDVGPDLHLRQRVEDGDTLHARLIQGATTSPDGKRLACSVLTKIYTMELDGGTPQRLTSGEEREFQPTYSADGRWIAYVTWTSEGGAIWKTPADGSGTPQRLTMAPAYYSRPVFTPDGTEIVALRASSYDRALRTFDMGDVVGLDVVRLPVGGGEPRLVVPARGVGGPHFGPESDRVYVYSEAGLQSMRLDGTDRRTHLQVKGPGYYSDEEPVPADDLRMSPAGGWALAHVRNQLYLVAVPHTGEAPTVNVGSPSLPLVQLTDVGADEIAWADGGKTITWSVGATFYRRGLDTVDFDEDKDKDKGKDAEDEKTSGNKKKNKKKDAEQEEETPKPLREEKATAVEVVVEVPRYDPQGTVALRGARIVTMNGDEVIEDGVVVVEGRRITAVGKSGEVEVPAGATTFDLAGKTIVPGFVDTHAHWTEIRRGVLDVENWSFLANLAYGVTAGLDVQTMTPDMFAYQDLADSGEILGPRAFSTGPGIFTTSDFQSEEQVLGVLRKYRDHYRTRNIKSYLIGNRKQRQWMVQACHELGMMPTTEGAIDLKLDLTHAVDGFAGNEHGLVISPLYEDVVELFARTGTSYTPTLLVNYGGPFAENDFFTHEDVHGDTKLRRFLPHHLVDACSLRLKWFHPQEYSYPAAASQAAKILRAGGRVGVGAHGQLQGLGYHWELWALQSGGLTPHEALRAATILGAEIIGYADDLGSVEPGKLADLVILDENPLEDIRNTVRIHQVMKNGELFDGDTLDEVYPESKPLTPLWSWDQDPR